MKLLGSTKSKKTKKNWGECSSFRTGLVLLYCNAVNNNYEQISRVLYTFVPNKPFRHLLDILAKTF